MSLRRLRPLWLLIFVCSALGAALYLLHVVGTNVIPGKQYYEVKAVFPNTVAMAQYADVRQNGVKVGDVSLIERGDGATSVATLEIDKEFAPVYRDATVLIRAKSIAEENYVEIDPGNPRSGEIEDGGELPKRQALESTQHDDVFSILEEERRRDLQNALGGLGPGLDSDNGTGLNRTLESSAAVTEDAAPLAQLLAEQRGQVASLVDSFGTVTRALGERREAIRVLTRQSTATAEAVADRDEALRLTVDQLPPFLAQSRTTANHLTGFSNDATPVVRDLRLATEDLVPTVRDLRPAAIEGQRTVRELDRFSRASLPTFERLDPFAEAARAFVPPFAGFLRQINPLSAYLDPYYRETTNWFANQGAHTQSRDEVSKVARVLLPISRSNFPGTIPPELEQFVDSLSGSADSRGSNAFPKPGEVNRSKPFEGDYPRLEADPPYRR